MSARQLRARLRRLTLSVRTAVGQDRDGAHGFTIDPTLAKTLRDDQQARLTPPAPTAEDLRLAVEAVIGKGELMTLAIGEKLAHLRAVEMKATDLAKFAKAVADTLLTTAKVRQQSSQGSSTTLPGVPGGTAKI